MNLRSIEVELEWEDNLGFFEGPIDHEQDGYMYSFELRLSVEGDPIFGTNGTPDIWIDDLVVFHKGYEIEVLDKMYKDIKQALTWS